MDRNAIVVPAAVWIHAVVDQFTYGGRVPRFSSAMKSIAVPVWQVWVRTSLQEVPHDRDMSAGSCLDDWGRAHLCGGIYREKSPIKQLVQNASKTEMAGDMKGSRAIAFLRRPVYFFVVLLKSQDLVPAC